MWTQLPLVFCLYCSYYITSQLYCIIILYRSTRLNAFLLNYYILFKLSKLLWTLQLPHAKNISSYNFDNSKKLKELVIT